jgi:F0F1-type ATP synthase gamma subunit
VKKQLSILVLSSHAYPSVRNSKEQKKIFFDQKNDIEEVYWYKQGAKEILQLILPRYFYNKIKNLLTHKIRNFKLKRFKTQAVFRWENIRW